MGRARYRTYLNALATLFEEKQYYQINKKIVLNSLCLYVVKILKFKNQYKTSAGGLPAEFDEDEFFMGYSVPRNKELMRIFKDLEMVEYLGSGVPRILRKYPRSIFTFTPNFIRITFPFEESLEGGQTSGQTAFTDQATDQATVQDDRLKRVLQFCKVPRSRIEIQEFLGLKHRRSFKENVLQPLLESGLLIQTIPDKPSSPKQRYITCNEHKGNE